MGAQMGATKTVNQNKRTAVIDFKPHKAQAEIAEACLQYRYVVVRAGRRFGKSALA